MWSCLVSFTTAIAPPPRRNNSRYPLSGNLSGVRSRFRCYGGNRSFFPLLGKETRLLGTLALSLVVTPIELIGSLTWPRRILLETCLESAETGTVQRLFTWPTACIDPYFLNLGTSWRWVVSFTPRPLYPRGKSHRSPLDSTLGGP
jgi:hypothetical protein